jgi:hypothetical protein
MIRWVPHTAWLRRFSSLLVGLAAGRSMQAKAEQAECGRASDAVDTICKEPSAAMVLTS